MHSFYLCPFHLKLRPSGINLVSTGLENIPLVPTNRATNAENHDARKVVPATLSVLNAMGLYFGLEARH